MLFLTILKVAIRSLWANKMRSFLAMLGIIIGVGAVISMLAFGVGAQRQILDRIASFGVNLLVVRPGYHSFRGVSMGSGETLKLEDAEAIVRQIANITQVAPAAGRTTQIKYLNKNTNTSVIGATVTYFPVRTFEIEKGRAFTEGEVERNARVAVLGPATAENLFGSENPLNETIKIRGVNFRVIGVTKPKGDQGWYNPDDQAFVPIGVAMKQLFGLDYLREINVQAAKGADLAKIQEAITTLMRKRHRIVGEAADDFEVRNQTDIIEQFTATAKTFTTLLAGIASISLLVGGIGIMNIMLVTVTERTREIGVRKAIGAKNRDILRQFLIEAMLMSGLGGSVGVGAGVGAAALVDRLTEFPTYVTPASVALALGFSVAVGIFFGFYPARRAAMLDPVEALRYE